MSRCRHNVIYLLRFGGLESIFVFIEIITLLLMTFSLDKPKCMNKI